MSDGPYPKYDGACQNESSVPKNPQATSGTPGGKSPEVPRPALKRNKPSISGKKGS